MTESRADDSPALAQSEHSRRVLYAEVTTNIARSDQQSNAMTSAMTTVRQREQSALPLSDVVCEHAVAVYDGRLFISGYIRRKDNGANALTKFVHIHPVSDAWREKPSPNTAQSGHGMMVVACCMFSAAGHGMMVAADRLYVLGRWMNGMTCSNSTTRRLKVTPSQSDAASRDTQPRSELVSGVH